ncbi:MAG: glycosyltransferase family 4 protein [Anaerolineales bacterium]|nr:glycosyltransferase family 4 protein [Anaerolineales bacterium]
MKIAVVLDQYFTHDGGAFTFQGELLRALAGLASESQHEFTIFSPTQIELPEPHYLQWQQYSRPDLSERGLLKLFRYWPSLEDKLAWQSTLERQIRAAGAEVAWFLSPRIRGLRMPYIPLVLDLQHRLQPQFPEVSARGEWQRRESHYGRWLPRAQAVVTGTRAGQEELQRFYGIPAERTVLLPHPTPQAALDSESKNDAARLARLGLQSGYLMYPAQLWFHKNHANLLQAIAILKKEGLILRLVLTGTDFGAGRDMRKGIDALGLQEQVKLLGFVEQEDLYALYRNALALTYVSFFGPENLPPLEAFALGCPVIAARVSGAEEQLMEAVLLVNPASPEEIAAAIRSVHQDGALRARLVQAGHERAQAWTTRDFVRGALGAFDALERSNL